MKILHFTTTFLPTLGGAQFIVKYLTEELSTNANLDTRFVTTTSNASAYLDGKTDTWSFGIDENKTKKRTFEIVFKLGQQIQKYRPDVILCHSAYVDLFFVYFSCLLSFRWPKIIVVSHGNDLGRNDVHGYGVSSKFLTRQLIKWLARKIDLLICPSKFQETQAQNLLKNSNIKSVVIPNGIPLQKNNLDQKGHRKKAFKLIILSSSRPIKRLEYALLALIDVCQANKNLMLYATCEDEILIETVKDAYKRAKIPKQISFIGHITGKKKEKTLSKMDGLLLPSLYENCPLVVLEAFNFQLIPFVSNVGGLPELIVNGETGFLFDPYDNKSLRVAVSSFLLDRAQGHNILKNIKKSKIKYGSTKMTDSYIEELERLCCESSTN